MFELPSLHYRRAFPRGGLYGMNVSEPEPREAIRGDRLFESQSHNSLVVMLKNLKLGSESDDSRDRYRTRRMSYY